MSATDYDALKFHEGLVKAGATVKPLRDWFKG